MSAFFAHLGTHEKESNDALSIDAGGSRKGKGKKAAGSKGEEEEEGETLFVMTDVEPDDLEALVLVVENTPDNVHTTYEILLGEGDVDMTVKAQVVALVLSLIPRVAETLKRKNNNMFANDRYALKFYGGQTSDKEFADMTAFVAKVPEPELDTAAAFYDALYNESTGSKNLLFLKGARDKRFYEDDASSVRRQEEEEEEEDPIGPASLVTVFAYGSANFRVALDWPFKKIAKDADETDALKFKRLVDTFSRFGAAYLMENQSVFGFNRDFRPKIKGQSMLPGHGLAYLDAYFELFSSKKSKLYTLLREAVAPWNQVSLDRNIDGILEIATKVLGKKGVEVPSRDVVEAYLDDPDPQPAWVVEIIQTLKPGAAVANAHTAWKRSAKKAKAKGKPPPDEPLLKPTEEEKDDAKELGRWTRKVAQYRLILLSPDQQHLFADQGVGLVYLYKRGWWRDTGGGDMPVSLQAEMLFTGRIVPTDFVYDGPFPTFTPTPKSNMHAFVAKKGDDPKKIRDAVYALLAGALPQVPQV